MKHKSIALDTSKIAKEIVDSTNEKDFEGKEVLVIKKDLPL